MTILLRKQRLIEAIGFGMYYESIRISRQLRKQGLNVQLTTKTTKLDSLVRPRQRYPIILKIQLSCNSNLCSQQSHSCGPRDLDCFTVWDQVEGGGGW